MQIQRPMLCARLKDPAQLRYPVLATPKLDGIRCLKVDGRVVSRAFKLIPNQHIRECMSQLPDGVDGELICDDFSSTQSAVMSVDGKPDFRFHMFDWCSLNGYHDRVYQMTMENWPSFVELVVPALVNDLPSFYQLEEAHLAAGYEGVVVRSFNGPYKFGRSTAREGFMFKFKRVDESEALIYALTEARENCNPVAYNNFGYTRRPGGQDLKIPKDTLGAFEVRDVYSKQAFSIGTGLGLDMKLREEIWNNQEAYIGRIVRYKYQGIGSQGRPRFPVFLGFREKEDMDSIPFHI